VSFKRLAVLTEAVPGFIQFRQVNIGIVLKLGHRQFLPHLLQFIGL
jgi:hypothetical protein